MKITVLGTGYVGIVTSVVFADFGHEVVGLDVIQEKVDNCNKGIPPIHEPGLEDLLKSGLASGNLTFTTDYAHAVKDTEVIFICVGTPQSENGNLDTKYVEASMLELAKHLDHEVIIVLKSTVPPGVQEHLQELVKDKMKASYEFASCPEFLREGTAIYDTLNPARIVLGVQSKESEDKLLRLHKPLPGERIVTDLVSAQMIKYAANGFLATKISFANSIALLCDKLGADVQDVMDGIGSDPRIGRSFLYPGIGFGGSCFPKDIKGLHYLSQQAGYDFKLIDEVDQINKQLVPYMVDRAQELVGDFKGKKVAMLGLAFKPNTDDMREARSVVMANLLNQRGANIVAYDPIATETAKVELDDSITYAQSAEEAIKEADVLFLVTEWDEFKKMDMANVKQAMKGDILIDGRNAYDPEAMKKLGFKYLGVGRR